MKTVTYSRFGGPEVLDLTEGQRPHPESGQLLVRVHAVSINPLDAKIRRGQIKFLSGSNLPRSPGLDFAGVVDAVGDGVDGFAAGNSVFGGLASFRQGTLAEWITVPAHAAAHMPTKTDFVGAASLAVGGLSALKALRNAAVRSGDRVLIIGSTGGIGLHALQLARRMGAHVTAVSRGREELSRQFGANEVLDVTHRADVRSWFPASTARFDAVLELSTRYAFDEVRPLLAKRGRLVGFEPSPFALASAAVLNVFRRQQHRFAFTKPSKVDLESLARSIDADELRPIPTQVFDLSDFRRAFELAEKGGLDGKAVIRLA